MTDLSDEINIFMRILELVGAFAGAISGVRLASVKRFDWFGASVIGFVTAVGGGTLRDMLMRVEPFWMSDPFYILASAAAVAWNRSRKGSSPPKRPSSIPSIPP